MKRGFCNSKKSKGNNTTKVICQFPGEGGSWKIRRDKQRWSQPTQEGSWGSEAGCPTK